MTLASKKSWIKLDKYLPVFKKIGFDALLADLDEKITALQQGILPAGSVSASELEQAVQDSLAKADSAIQPGVSNDIADIADPSTATAEDVANKVNAVLAELRTLGLLNA